MVEDDDTLPSPFWRWAKIAGLSLVTLFLGGAAAGFIAAHVDDGKALSITGGAILAGIVILFLVSLWLLYRVARKPDGAEPLTRREQLNRNIMIACALVGGLLGAMTTLAAGDTWKGSFNLFSDEPLPLGVAIVTVVLIGLVVPVLSYLWHRRAVDELEEAAYRAGALYGLYVYMIGAPVWWFAWRGGFAPEPNGPIIYFATMLVVGVVWISKKYR